MTNFGLFVDKLAARARDPMNHAPALIACLGDSVTHGCFELYPRPGGAYGGVYDAEAVYGEQLRRVLSARFPGAAPSLLNAGVGGDNAPGGLGRLERDVLSRKPDLVIICYGLNDSGQREAGLAVYSQAMDGILEKLEGIPAIVLTPCMMCTEVSGELAPVLVDAARNCADIQNSGCMDDYMQAAREVAQRRGAAVCDEYQRQKALHAQGVDTNLLLSNHINHPTREVHRQWGQDLANLILGTA